MDFEKMLDELARGDRGAFERFYDRYGLPVYRYILEKTGDPEQTRVLWKNVFRSLMARLRAPAAGPTAAGEPDLPLLLLTALADLQLTAHPPVKPEPDAEAHRLSSELVDELRAATEAAPAPEAPPAPAAKSVPGGRYALDEEAAPANAYVHAHALSGDAEDASADETAPAAAADEESDAARTTAQVQSADDAPDESNAAPAQAEIAPPAQSDAAEPQSAPAPDAEPVAEADAQPAASSDESADGADTPAPEAPPAADEPENAPARPAIPHPVIANPADAAAAVTDFAPEEPHRSPAGRAVLLVLLILLALVLVWGAVGAAMSAQLLPEFDLGYGWFNETIYPVFSAFPMQ